MHTSSVCVIMHTLLVAPNVHVVCETGETDQHTSPPCCKHVCLSHPPCLAAPYACLTALWFDQV